MVPPAPITSFSDLTSLSLPPNTPLITMFSGGVDSSYLLLRLRLLKFTNIHAVSVNLGGPSSSSSLSTLHQSASLFNAKFILLDGRHTFLTSAILPAIRAQARYFSSFPISSSLSRPVIAALVVEYARTVGGSVILHTANRSQNSLPRLNNGIRLAGWEGVYGSPYEMSVIPREEKIKALREMGITCAEGRGWSSDMNLWCNEFESGEVEDPGGFEVPEGAYVWTRGGGKREGRRRVMLGFERGELTEVDGRRMELGAAVEGLNVEVGRWGIGRYTGLEHILAGERDEAAVLEVREAPAATVIFEGLDHLVAGSLKGDEIAVLKANQQMWAREAAAGRWESETHVRCESEIKRVMERVSGSVSFVMSYRLLQLCGVSPKRSICVRNRDEWEMEQASKRGKDGGKISQLHL